MGERLPPIEVFGIGQCSLDYIGKIEAYPPPDRKCEFVDMVIHRRGPVATALVALARWGISCTFAGILGDDLFGWMIGESLEAEGIDTAGVGISEKGFLPYKGELKRSRSRGGAFFRDFWGDEPGSCSLSPGLRFPPRFSPHGPPRPFCRR